MIGISIASSIASENLCGVCMNVHPAKCYKNVDSMRLVRLTFSQLLLRFYVDKLFDEDGNES